MPTLGVTLLRHNRINQDWLRQLFIRPSPVRWRKCRSFDSNPRLRGARAGRMACGRIALPLSALGPILLRVAIGSAY
jgi:hypothetical protein